MFAQFADTPLQIVGINVLSEVVGLIFFIFGLTSSSTDPMAQNVIIGTVILFSMQHAGALYNPVVTLNLVLRKKMSIHEFAILSITQILSAIIGAMLAYYTFGVVLQPSFSATTFSQYAQQFSNDLLFTFFLVLLINVQITDEIAFTQNKVLVGVLFMLVLSSCRQGSSASGSVMNPAIGIGLPIVAYMFVKDYDSIHLIWVWTIAPVIGGILAYFFFEYVYLPHALNMRKSKKGQMNTFMSIKGL